MSDWQSVTSDKWQITTKLSVDGGYLYSRVCYLYDKKDNPIQVSSSMVFVPHVERKSLWHNK